MNAEAQCSQTLLLQADYDGELDAAESATLEAHRAGCVICSQALSQLQASRAVVHKAQRFSAPDALRKEIPRRSAESLMTRKKFNFVFGAAIGALAAGVLAFFLVGSPGKREAESIVDNHVRAMQSPTHLLDVASSEHHTVKPWFSGQIEFAPPVKDLEAFGYPLRGGRVDVVAGRKIAVLVYQAGRHTIDVSIEPQEDSLSAPAELHGFNIRHWNDTEFGIWAISDLNSHELDAFVEQWKTLR